MSIAADITQVIGKTPLVYLNKLNSGLAKIAVKLEFFNPGGSIKDRLALSLIEDAERKGKIDSNSTIIEASSGNTGIGLAMICAVKNYRLIITMPESASAERRKLMKAYGAEIILTPSDKGMNGAIEKAWEISKQIKNSYYPLQFENPANPFIHEKTTAEEIWFDTEKQIDIFVSGVGTGGTFTGTSTALKRKNPNIVTIAVEPENSAVISGEKAGKHKIQGIGAGFVSKILNRELINELIKVSDSDALGTAKSLAKEEGILCGISSGANVYAALQLAKRPENKDKLIVTIIADTGERYLSTELFQ
ncbi:MAG: cysteine synthase A [Bacteroidales bacterium]|nr:cysteine synthase A [Bacteroidales bacterium]